jgi:hypothetical protein
MRLLSSTLALLLAYVFVCLEVSAGGEPLAFPLGEPPFAAELANIDSEWNVEFQIGDKLRVVAAKDLAYWGRYREVDQGPKIVLVDGSVIRADVLLLDEKQVVLGDATGLGRGQWDESKLPREAVWAIVYQPPASLAAFDRILESLQAAPHYAEQLVLHGGETISGTLLDAPKGGRFAPEGVKPGAEIFSIARANVQGPLSIPAAKVVAFRSATPPSGRTTGGVAWLGLTDGSLLNSRSITIKGDEVSVNLAAGGTLKTTLAGHEDPEKTFWDAIEYIQPFTQRVTWLSAAKPLGYKHIPFLNVERPLGSDRNVLGSRLRAGGATYLHGLGMPSTSRVAYDVTGYRKFAAELALDDEGGSRGSVVFRILLQAEPNEWTPAYQSPTLRGGDAPLPISVDLKGASRMALIVDFEDRGDECDWADWLNARLEK